MRIYLIKILMFLLFASGFDTLQVYGGGGGGSGRPITPYADSVRIEDIIKQKDSAQKTIDLEIISSKAGSSQWYSGAAFAYMKSRHDSIHPVYTIEGNDKNGKKHSISFDCIKEMTIIALTKEFADVRVTIFPALSPDSLLLIKPRYGLLDSVYNDSVELKIAIAGKAVKTKLYIVARKYVYGDRNTACAFQSLKKGDRVVFTIDKHHIWWAIPSVITDKKYPYRYQLKK